MSTGLLLLSLLFLPRTEMSGGEGTVLDTTRNAYSRVVRNVSSSQHRRDFHVGNSFFNENWVIAPASTTDRDGLGPHFSAISCSSCHFKDGRGFPFSDRGLVLRLSLPGGHPEPSYGDQLQIAAIPGVQKKADFEIHYEDFEGKFKDGQTYSLRRPSLKYQSLSRGAFHKSTEISVRLAPGVFGLGLLEAIPEKAILANEDPEDSDSDGISGRANWVRSIETGKRSLGRFGWKANQVSILEQTASAFAGDMGITSYLKPDENCLGDEKCVQQPHGGSPEISNRRLEQVVTYMKLLAVPAARSLNDPEVQEGEKIFNELGCATCHVSTFKTGEIAGFPELSHQVIHPFTDLLLHDMGEDLADNRPDAEADGREWRTPPLWGLGLLQTVNGHSFLLHDGRARNIEEAILWHGGEAQHSRDEYKKLSLQQRQYLLQFLESL